MTAMISISITGIKRIRKTAKRQQTLTWMIQMVTDRKRQRFIPSIRMEATVIMYTIIRIKATAIAAHFSTSGAMVKVYTGNQIIAKYSVPTGKNGTLWHVFDYDPSAGVVTGVNEMTNLYSPSSLSRGYDRTLAQREEIWQDIQENPKEETQQKPDISETESETAETEQMTDSESSELEEVLGVLPEEERTVLRMLAESRNREDAEKAAVPFADLPEPVKKTDDESSAPAL